MTSLMRIEIVAALSAATDELLADGGAQPWDLDEAADALELFVDRLRAGAAHARGLPPPWT